MRNFAKVDCVALEPGPCVTVNSRGTLALWIYLFSALHFSFKFISTKKQTSSKSDTVPPFPRLVEFLHFDILPSGNLPSFPLWYVLSLIHLVHIADMFPRLCLPLGWLARWWLWTRLQADWIAWRASLPDADPNSGCDAAYGELTHFFRKIELTTTQLFVTPHPCASSNYPRSTTHPQNGGSESATVDMKGKKKDVEKGYEKGGAGTLFDMGVTSLRELSGHAVF